MVSRKKKVIIILVAVVIFIGVATCSSEFMLRAAVFLYSPSSAFSMKYKYIGDETNNVRLYKITENAPIEKGTEGELTTWAVYSFGPFHYAKYFGEA